MVVHEIHSKQEFKEALENHATVLVDFWASWCGPCRMISPIIEKYSEFSEYSSIYFCKLEIDAAREVSDELGIQTVPTCAMHKGGTKGDEVHGAFPQIIEQMLRKYVKKETDPASEE
ncbi:thioredoxin-like protein [Fusarium redolens]|uniref:Thioredoxin-like protein n=1 Tax=Fusarium redolens TaxID=48865 RepID=A0A9P9GQ23_FUSRE|nr:thioredoxin-like protein [Fusarium redolens]KAH7243634.1 thioredoxin-like protein [Fusarium redolens]